MSRTPQSRIGSLAAVAGLFLSACAISPITVISSASPKSETTPAAPAPVAAPAPTPVAVPVVFQLAVIPERSGPADDELHDAVRAINGTALFFDTGSADLSKEGKVKLLKVAEVLRNRPELRVRIEGNADERGPTELNSKLAARRAEVARDFLVLVAVPAHQITVVSHGEEKPLAPGKGEQAWELNRRDDVNLVKDTPQPSDVKK